jgi:hypothetical protein
MLMRIEEATKASPAFHLRQGNVAKDVILISGGWYDPTGGYLYQLAGT